MNRKRKRMALILIPAIAYLLVFGGGVAVAFHPRPAHPNASSATPPRAARFRSNHSPAGSSHAIKTVFLIVMENHNWSQIKGSPSASYINSLLRRSDASYATQYFNPPGIHPSEPNYVWLEAGGNANLPNKNLGRTVTFSTDDDPSASNSTSTTDHLVNYLARARVSWKTYQEDISGRSCPLTGRGLYAAKHNPFVFFQDVTNNNRSSSTTCIAHERPFPELTTDLAHNTVARYNFITPNLCDDMHNSVGCTTGDAVKNGDSWLAKNLPMILGSRAYKHGGAVFLTWDESEGGDVPIGMIVLSPDAKGHGYHNAVHYTHSSTLRTLEEIFGVHPLLRAARTAPDLSNLFRVFP